MLKLVWVDELDPARTDDVRRLLLAARESDGRPQVRPTGPLPEEFHGGRHLLGQLDAAEDDLVGYAHLDTAGDAFGRQVAELIVHPSHRGRGHGAALLDELLRTASRPRVWSHGDHPAAAALAKRFGLERARELLVMRALTTGADWPEPKPMRGLRLRTFVPGEDEQGVIDVNARAFDWHPEQSAFGVEDLRRAEQEDWFDPDGFFLAENESGRIVGFHWTKVHEANPDRFGGEPVGEVYVVGVDPSAQGGGLGKALTLAGLRHLRALGLRQVILYVEGDNAPAVAVYRGLGFETVETDVQYAP
ncbi:mycothiol synthase [Saccharomonospora amisosensis]|uniref:Mycothiol acetyltransferase n=1 Tax=Saccharomonospora amisosensis TaxID=1128677 RepID=A0A7X5UV40_9PSEU|nr:mycothiol synthase [Saccharomonospora amisosensis]NIJ14839.1 mycothiol synthase [Saccharomonospora amisosensis]